MNKFTPLLHLNRPFAASFAALLAAALWVAPIASYGQTEKAAPGDAQKTDQPTVTESAAQTDPASDDTKKANPEQNTCQLCHQNRVTLTLQCSSLDYRRHVSHGDSVGPCPPSRPAPGEE